MLKVRKGQFDAFLSDEEGFISFIIGHLCEESPELIERIPPDDLREMVRNGLARARSHGLRSPGDLAAFVSIMFEIAPNFDEHPAIRQALDDARVPVDKRIDTLFERVPEKAWEEAEKNYDAKAWFPELQDEQDEKE